MNIKKRGGKKQRGEKEEGEKKERKGIKVLRNSGGGGMKGHEADLEMKVPIAGDISEVAFSISTFAFFIITLLRVL